MEQPTRTKIIILAGGKGVRMQSDLPKVLVPVRGKSMIAHLLESVRTSGIDEKPVIVVGYGKEKVMATLGPGYMYVVQDAQLGTGHAVLTAEELLHDSADNIMVLYGDSPFLKATTIRALADKHIQSGSILTMLTVKLPDFDEWRSFFYKSFSRIIRNEKHEIVRSVEFKDASDAEKKVLEVNPCYFMFDATWLWEKIKNLKNNNIQKEYYLTDLVALAIGEKVHIESIQIEATEALAANSKEELEVLERLAPKN